MWGPLACRVGTQPAHHRRAGAYSLHRTAGLQPPLVTFGKTQGWRQEDRQSPPTTRAPSRRGQTSPEPGPESRDCGCSGGKLRGAHTTTNSGSPSPAPSPARARQAWPHVPWHPEFRGLGLHTRRPGWPRAQELCACVPWVVGAPDTWPSTAHSAGSAHVRADVPSESGARCCAPARGPRTLTGRQRLTRGASL